MPTTNMRFRDRTHAQYENADEKPPQEVGLRDRLAHFTWYALRGEHCQRNVLMVPQAMVRMYHVYRLSRRRSGEHAKQVYRPTDDWKGGLHRRLGAFYYFQHLHVCPISPGSSENNRIAASLSRGSLLRHILGFGRPHTELYIHIWQPVNRTMAYQSPRNHVLDVLCRCLSHGHRAVFALLPLGAP